MTPAWFREDVLKRARLWPETDSVIETFISDLYSQNFTTRDAAVKLLEYLGVPK